MFYVCTHDIICETIYYVKAMAVWSEVGKTGSTRLHNGMAQLFSTLFGGVKPQNGELTINLNLTIKIEADGSLKVTPTAEAAPQTPPPLPKPEDVKWEMPDLEIGEDSLINFGKNV